MKLLFGSQLHLGGLCVAGEVIAGSVSTPHTLHPPLHTHKSTQAREMIFTSMCHYPSLSHIRCLALCVPAVCCIVGHLVAKVLPEAQLTSIHPNLQKKLVDATQVVP